MPTITSNDDKFIVVGKLVHSDIREGRDNLLLWRQVCTLLELEITNGAGKGKVSVDTAKVDEPTSCSNARLLS